MYISPEYKNEKLNALDVIMASVNYGETTNISEADIDGDGTVDEGTFTKLHTSVNFSQLLNF